MTKGTLLSASAWFCLISGSAAAQVSVPLPGKNPPRPTSQQQQVPVPLPGAPASPAPKGPDTPPPANPGLPVLGQDSIGKLPIGKYGRPDINPYDRDMDLTVPLMFRRRMLGDLPIRLTYDDRLLVDSKAFLSLIRPLLSEAANAQVAAKLASLDRFTAEDLAALGISFEYDPSSLAVVVLTIDPGQRAVEKLFRMSKPEDEKPDLMPASFAAFLNINALEAYNWKGENNAPPTVNLNGAIRYGGIVFEGDGQFAQRGFTSDAPYVFDRTYARLVYDEPGDYRRWFLGDLSPEVRGQQGFIQMGGIGVTRQRRRFDPYRSSVLQGNRQLVLQRDSSVRILRNGVLYRELRLDAGSYDFTALPLVAGSNDVQIEVRDASGGVQTVSYSSYLDPIDLVPGDYEYGAYLGPTSTNFGRSPKYNGPVAFSGFFRKAFVNAPAVGVGVQASARVQTLTAQTQFVLRGGTRILLDGGVSHSRDVGEGVSAGVGLDQIIDRGGLVDSASLRVDYLSRRYAFLSSPEADNVNAINFSGQYTRAITTDLSLLFSGNYLHSRGDRGDSYRIGASGNYYFNPRLSLRAGVEYTKFDSSIGRAKGFGFNISLVFQPSYRDRLEARHDSSSDVSSLSYLHSSSNRIGSLGYGAVATRDGDSVTGQGFVDYIANRFDATLSHSSYGPDFSSFGSQNVTALRVGTSIAFADGAFGIGRRINDSFAVLYPHENLRGHAVVAGQSLASNEYMSKSGVWGGAVNSYLSSYVDQPIQYDVENPPPGYDVGDGVVHVNPPYHSGYKLRIGTDAFVSAAGVLMVGEGKPLSLVGGRVFAADGKDKEPLPFFTNSVGRFAIQNLRPGVRYRVELAGGQTMFEFTVPEDTTGLVDLKTIVLKGGN